MFGFYRIFFCFVWLILVVFSAEAFEIHGFVYKNFSKKAGGLAGVKIYEKYADDQPVAITDKDGRFLYETGSDVPVDIYPIKSGWFDGGMLVTKEMAEEREIEIDMLEWWVKKDDFDVYAIVDGDKDCKLNAWINVSAFCLGGDNLVYYRENNYPLVFLNGETCDTYGSGVYPNSEGKFIVRNLNPLMSFFTAQWHGGEMFFDKPTESFYYNVTQEQVDIYIETQEQWFKLGKSMGAYKEYDDWPAYKSAFEKNLYKFCKKKLDKVKESPGGGGTINNTSELSDKKQAYIDAKKKEQSLANRTLTAATVAATGLGMMEMMMGKAEQRADAATEQDMAAYMATMRCTYAGGKSVKAGPEEVELPGGNDAKLMKYRSEYMSLAKDLKERKEVLGMQPGIESEEILDKAEMGLYDDENKGIEGGAYESLYRAKQGSEEDQKKIDADKEKSAKSVKYGAIAAAGGAVLGVVGNSLVNGKLGELLRNKAQGTDMDPEQMKQELIIQQAAFDTEPDNCSWAECLSRATITDRTRSEPYYKTVAKLCSEQFPDNPDCPKIILMYSHTSNTMQEYDTLVANKYDMDYYKRFAKWHCDWYICEEDAYMRDTELFSERDYADKESSQQREKVSHDIRKCLKTAQAVNFYNFYVPYPVETDIVIDFDKVDCSKLDEGKKEGDVFVKGLDINEFMWPSPNFQKIKQLFGKYGEFVTMQENKRYRIGKQRLKDFGLE